MDKNENFAERTARMFAIANDLRLAADEIRSEAERMKLAQDRFAARKDKPRR